MRGSLWGTVARATIGAVLAVLLTSAAAPAAMAVGPQCTDSNLPNRLNPVPFNGHAGRITVLFDDPKVLQYVPGS
jgi:hypothetical protein